MIQIQDTYVETCYESKRNPTKWKEKVKSYSKLRNQIENVVRAIIKYNELNPFKTDAVII